MSKRGSSAKDAIDLTVDDDNSNDDDIVVLESGPSPKKRTVAVRRPPQDEGGAIPVSKTGVAASLFDCAICLESNVKRFQGYQLTACGHVFCRECLYSFIRSKAQDKNLQGLVCPNPACQKDMALVDVRACTLEIGAHELWQTCQDLSTERYLDAAAASHAEDRSTSLVTALPSLPLRRCPTNHCNYIFEWEAPSNPDVPGQRFDCPKCGQGYCLNCPVTQRQVGPAHAQSCFAVLEETRQSQERQRKLKEWQTNNAQADERFQQLLQTEGAQGKTRPCPHCGVPITKHGGCHHMRCTACHRRFTWRSPRSTRAGNPRYSE